MSADAPRLEPVPAATLIVDERFPEATCAILGGSSVTPFRTDLSDLDIVVVSSGFTRPFRHTFEDHRWLVEVFAETPAALQYYWDKDLESRCPTLIRICAAGVIVRNRQAHATAVQEQAQSLLAAGPRPLSSDELLWARYVLTGLLHDYTATARHEEAVYTATLLLNRATDLVLSLNRCWLGSGKWSARHLEEFDPSLAASLQASFQALVADKDRTAFAALVSQILDEAGGQYQAGFFQYGVDLPADIPDSI